jgi:hypothetical protein
MPETQIVGSAHPTKLWRICPRSRWNQCRSGLPLVSRNGGWAFAHEQLMSIDRLCLQPIWWAVPTLQNIYFLSCVQHDSSHCDQINSFWNPRIYATAKILNVAIEKM